jgi:tetratricopeptide (TPR) repeat protein
MRGLQLGLLILAFSSAAVAQGSDKIAAEALFEAGRQALERGDYAAACDRFEESLRLDSAVGTLLNLANCKQKTGQLATAWQLFREAAQRLPPKDARRKIAEQRASELRKRVPQLVITLGAGAPPDTVVTSGGVELRAASFGVALPMNPGRHELLVTAPGHDTRSYPIELGEGQALELSVLPGPAQELTTEPPPPSPPPATPTALSPTADRTESELASLSHAAQLGAFARVDLDAQGAGAVLAPGISYGLGDRLEPAIAALVGAHRGIEPSATLLLSERSLKPRVSLAAPIFFVEGARVGVRAAVGAGFDPSRHFGLFGELGGAWFPAPPPGHRSGALVASLGVQTRL